MSTMVKVKEQSYIGQRRELASKQEQRVAELQEMSYEELCHYKFISGINYLDDYCGDDYGLYKRLSTSKTWWGWWKNQWTSRDDHYLAPHNLKELRYAHVEYRRACYDVLHNTRELACRLVVPQVIIASAMRSFGHETDEKMNVKRVVFGNHGGVL